VRKYLSRAIKAATAVAVALLLPLPVLAQTAPVTPPYVSMNFSISTASTGLNAGANAAGTTAYMPIAGYGTCSIAFGTSVGSGASITVQGASDSPNAGTYSPQTVTAIGTSGVITNPSIGQAFGGAVTPQALTYIRLNVTALSSGTVAGSMTCSNASGASNGTVAVSSVGGTVSVTLATNPCAGGTLNYAAITVATASTLTIQALSAGKSIYVCKLFIYGGGTTTATLEQSTSSTCASGLTAITGPINLTASSGWVEPAGVAPNYVTASSDSLCLVNSAAVQVSGSIVFVQQ